MADRPGFVAGASAPVVPATVVNDASVFGRRIAIDPCVVFARTNSRHNRPASSSAAPRSHHYGSALGLGDETDSLRFIYLRLFRVLECAAGGVAESMGDNRN